MSTFNQIREGVSEAWNSLVDGWQRMYQRAAGAITRFQPDHDTEDMLEQRGASSRSIGWGVLTSEVFDSGDQVTVRIEVPGMNKKDFEIDVLADCLVVRGEKRVQREESRGRYHITECAYGRFERAVPLSIDVEPDSAKATYKDGVLRIDLKKSTNGRKRRIVVDG
ncbi:MAG: Hsp20/alpha crystallin family protein [Gammaproteobacteria bacterium]